MNNPSPSLDFFIIGAPKSATTWLAHALAQHPDIFLPEHELHQFSWHHDTRDPLPQTYARHFHQRKPHQLCGERSNSYLADPITPLRLHTLFPASRLIAILREPASRAYSHYCMLYRLDQIEGDIHTCLDPDIAGDNKYLRAGRYAEHLERYLTLFARESMHILLQDDVRHDPATVYRQTCRFLGVNEDFTPEALTGQKNTRDELRINNRLRNTVMNHRWLRRPGQAVARSTLYRRFLRPKLLTPVELPPFPVELRKRLQDYYRDDTEHLARLLGRSLDHWQTA